MILPELNTLAKKRYSDPGFNIVPLGVAYTN